MKYYEDPILGKGRAADVSGGTGGGGGTTYVAGTGINISGDTISVSDVPVAEIDGLDAELATKQNVLTAGYRMEIVTGSTISQKKWFSITNVTGTSVTMQPGEAYKIQATTAAVTINTTEIPSDQYGLEGHLEIFVSGTGYVVTGTNVVLSNALEPDSVNNCTVRFHDGLAIISVEDHVAGYIVVSASGSTVGTLPYALSTATQEYIAVDASLNGQTLDLGGVTTSAGEKHVVGNGYENTIVSGSITFTSKTTFSNLSMDGVSVLGGTMTLGDVNIPNGATVAVSGGGLAVEKVVGDGTVNLGGTHVVANNCNMSGITIRGGSYNGNGGALYATNGKLSFDKCVFSGNVVTGLNRYGGAVNIEGTASFDMNNCIVNSNSGAVFGGGIAFVNVSAGNSLDIRGSTIAGNSASYGGGLVIFNTTCTISGSTISGNTGTTGKDIYITTNGTANVLDSVIGDVVLGNGTTITFGGTNTVTNIAGKSGSSGSVVISSGASINLTSSIAPGGTSRITVLTGGCTVNGNAIAAGTFTSINSNGTAS